MPDTFVIDEVKLEDLVRRAVRNARPRKCEEVQRWVAVGDAFAVGSTWAMQLCKYFNLDPHEMIHGPLCNACDDIPF